MKKSKDMDAIIKRNYKGAEINVIVEDDVITTGKIYVGGVFVMSCAIYDANDNEVTNTEHNLNMVFSTLSSYYNKRLFYADRHV